MSVPTRLTLRGRINPVWIIAQVAEMTSVSMADITGEGRDAHLVMVRHAAMAIVAASRRDLSLPQIASFFGQRDHTTILHALRKHGRPAQVVDLAAVRSEHREIDQAVLDVLLSSSFTRLDDISSTLPGISKAKIGYSLQRLKNTGLAEARNQRWTAVSP